MTAAAATTPPPPARDGITVAAACGLLGISRQTWWRHQEDPGWPRAWTVGGARRVSRSDVLAFRDGRKVAASDRRRELATMAQP